MHAERLRVAPDVELQVEVTGPADAPVWLHAHGVGSSGRFVQAAFADAVHDAGYQLATYDLRGHGSSDPDRTPEGHALSTLTSDMVTVATHVDARILGGVSIGGHAAVMAAAHRQVERVVVCLPAWTGSAVAGRGPHAAVADQVRTVGIAGMIEAMAADTTMAGWLRETLVTDFTRADAASLAAALTSLDGGRAPAPTDVAALGRSLVLVSWPDDPGHPDEVARAWARMHGATQVATSIASLEGDLGAFGRAAAAGLQRASR